MTTLDKIARLLYAEGEAVVGWVGSEDDLISLAATTFPGKPFCMVKQWILIDLIVTAEERGKLTRLGLLPATLYAHEVVLDSQGRFQPRMWVRSNFGVSLTDYIFETNKTVYLLLGPGVRKEATVGAAFSMKAG
ncbi:MAG: DUF6957 family protein [Pseudomonas sp.]